MNPNDKDVNVDSPGRGPLGDIDPKPDTRDHFPEKSPRDLADEREGRRSTRVNDDDVGAERRDREQTDPQKNPRTGPIG